jgi:hypothetical protein
VVHARTRPVDTSRVPLLRIFVEQGLLGLLWIARSACFAQGLAFSTALLAAPWLGRADAPPWLAGAVRSCAWLGATFFATGVLVVVARYLPRPRADEAAEPPPWLWLLGLSLVALPALAIAGASPLLPLWREIRAALDQIGFWEAFRGADPFAGLFVLPILAALFVPALEAVAAFFLIAPPLALAVLLATRSHLLPRLFAMTAACQAGLVLASLIGADAFSRLAAEALAAMSAAPDAEVHRAAEELRRAQGVLASVAGSFGAPLLGYLVGAAGLWLARGAGAFFTAGSIGAASGSASPAGPDGVQTGQPLRAGPQRARIALVALGSLLLAVATAQLLEGRETGERRRRHTFVGGAALVALGALLPRLPRRG